MMNEAAAAGRPSVMERLFEGVQDEVGVRPPAGSPADDPRRERWRTLEEQTEVGGVHTIEKGVGFDRD